MEAKIYIAYTHSSTTSSPSAMDWFSWLSKTSLEPSLVYEYGLAFSRNELQFEDIIYFNHEFLQSMGISIAKHRLEILKLAKKEDGAVPPRTMNHLSGVIKKCLKKCLSLSKLVSREEEDNMQPEPNWSQGKWRGAMLRKRRNEDFRGEKGIHRSRTMALSGPLDGTMHEKMFSSKLLRLSGPLDGRMNEKMGYTNRTPMITRPSEGGFLGAAKSPRLSGPPNVTPGVHNRSPMLVRPSDERAESPMGYSPHNKSNFEDEYSIWPTLFEDLKPT